MRPLIRILTLLLLSVNTFAQTTLVLQPNAATGKDASLVSSSPTINYGSSDQINPRAWTISGSDSYLRALLEFDMSTLPANAVITSAKLNLYFNNTASSLYENSGTNEFWIQRVTSAWDENTVTWNNQPTVTSTNRVSVPTSTSATQDYTNLDVTELVKDILDNPSSSYGFLLSLKSETTYKSAMMSSSDHANSALHPKLEITYTLSNVTATCISLQPGASTGKDADVVSSSPTINAGASPQINPRAWTINSDENTLRSYIEFDLSILPNDAEITDAKLNLYFNPTASSIYQNTGSNQLWIKRVTSAWDESTITWNTQPTVTETNRVSVPASTSSTQNYLDLNVTQLLEDIIANPSSSHGFMLTLQSEVVYKSVMMSSSDHPNSALHPKLDICYTSSIATGILQANHGMSSKIYPNPFTTSTTIELSESINLDDAVISIYDLTGTEVQSGVIKSSDNAFKVERGNLKEGLYFFTIKSGSNIISTGKLNILN